MNTNDTIEKCAGIAEAEEDNGPDLPFDNGSTRDGWRMACAKIAAAIRALKSSLPAETVSEAKVKLPERMLLSLDKAARKLADDAQDLLDNYYDIDLADPEIDRVNISIQRVRYALSGKGAAALAHADDGWRPIESDGRNPDARKD